MSTPDLDAADTLVGPEVRPANRSLDAAGSIHDDSTAAHLGFRGGTVAGNIHLDHFGPLLLERFGSSWFESGVLSMYFRTPTTHLEPVRAVLGPPDAQSNSEAWVVTAGHDLVGEGDVGLGASTTGLQRRDRRPIDDRTSLAILDMLPVRETIEAGQTSVDIERQRLLRADTSLMTAPIPWYDGESPWGGPVACPSVAVDTLWAPFERRLRGLVRPAVGLYGAIELRNLRGPLLAGVDYDLAGIVETISRSPKTEVFWATTTASRDGDDIASLTMMIRLLTPPDPG